MGDKMRRMFNINNRMYTLDSQSSNSGNTYSNLKLYTWYQISREDGLNKWCTFNNNSPCSRHMFNKRHSKNMCNTHIPCRCNQMGVAGLLLEMSSLSYGIVL